MRNIKELLKDWKEKKIQNDIYTTTDEYNNNVMVEATDDYLKLTTYQDNGWSRVNYYYLDGTTEELYEK